jgi:hypothetical protein
VYCADVCFNISCISFSEKKRDLAKTFNISESPFALLDYLVLEGSSGASSRHSDLGEFRTVPKAGSYCHLGSTSVAKGLHAWFKE